MGRARLTAMTTSHPFAENDLPDDDHLSVLAAAGFEPLDERPVPGTLRRLLTVLRHLLGLAGGAWVDRVRRQKADGRRGLGFRLRQGVGLLWRPFLDRDLRREPFPVQFRRRLETLGPTYIKLGQMLSLRRDLLPRDITDELGRLLDQLPAVTYPRFCALVSENLGRPTEAMFSWIEAQPTGSASIAQSHRAATLEGDSVIIKVVKPGIREILQRDARLLRALGTLLQVVWRRYQPRRVIDELVTYTVREADLAQEADNAEIFASHFQDEPDVVFPRIFRRYSSDRVLTMEFFAGVRPDSPAAQRLSEADRDRIVDLGASAIIRMIYRDGFFHADLHPGNLLVLKGPRAGFIDVGMVGRLDDELRRALLYYFYCLTAGDAHGAARYLTAVAEPLAGGEPEAFRRAVEDTSRRWHQTSTYEDFSLAQLILESIALGGRFRMRFPVEMVLMVKALVTFESVGSLLRPGYDVARLSRPHVMRVFLHAFSPLRLAREGLRNAPELVDAAVKVPLLVTEGVRLLEQATRKPADNPFTGVRGTIFGGFCLVAAAIVTSTDGPWWLAGSLFAGGLIAALRRGR